MAPTKKLLHKSCRHYTTCTRRIPGSQRACDYWQFDREYNKWLRDSMPLDRTTRIEVRGKSRIISISAILNSREEDTDAYTCERQDFDKGTSGDSGRPYVVREQPSERDVDDLVGAWEIEKVWNRETRQTEERKVETSRSNSIINGRLVLTGTGIELAKTIDGGAPSMWVRASRIRGAYERLGYSEAETSKSVDAFITQDALDSGRMHECRLNFRGEFPAPWRPANVKQLTVEYLVDVFNTRWSQ